MTIYITQQGVNKSTGITVDFQQKFQANSRDSLSLQQVNICGLECKCKSGRNWIIMIFLAQISAT